MVQLDARNVCFGLFTVPTTSEFMELYSKLVREHLQMSGHVRCLHEFHVLFCIDHFHNIFRMSFAFPYPRHFCEKLYSLLDISIRRLHAYRGDFRTFSRHGMVYSNEFLVNIKLKQIFASYTKPRLYPPSIPLGSIT